MGGIPGSYQNQTGVKMLKKIIAGLLLFGTVTFGMSLTKLNSASKAELMEINGVGEVKAAEIVKQRRKGKFKSFADLQERVDGIGEQTADNIKRDVKVANDVKKVKKTTKKKMKSMTKKKANAKNDTKKKLTKKRKAAKDKADEKKKETKAKTKRKAKSKASDVKKETTKKKRRMKKAADKKKELKKKPRKTRVKKTKVKKLKKKAKN